MNGLPGALGAFAGVLGERPAASSTRFRLFTGKVTASHAGGVYVTELDHDEVGAAKITWGATYRDTSTCPDAAHTHPLRQLPQGAIVLAAETDHGVWIIRHDEGSTTT